MNVDFIGKASVSKLIIASKLSKFVIFPYGYERGTTPVYESIEGKNSQDCKQNFEKWCDTMLEGNPNNTKAYDMILFDEVREYEGKDGGKIQGRATNRRNKYRFSFSLASNERQISNFPDTKGMSREEVGSMISDTLEKLHARNREDRLLKRLERIEDRLNDDDEDEETSNDKPDTWDKIAYLIERFGRKKKISAVNGRDPDDDEEDDEDDEDDGDALLGQDSGYKKRSKKKRKEDDEEDEEEDDEEDEEEDDEEDGEEDGEEQEDEEDDEEQDADDIFRANIKQALNVLVKHDKKLDKDLLKLALVARKKPATFKMIIAKLREMKL